MAKFSFRRSKAAADAPAEAAAPKPKKRGKGFDTAKLQAFFVEHGEKMLLGVAGLLFLYLAYGALTRTTFDRTPEQLQSVAQQVQQQIQTATPTDDWFTKEGISFAPINLPPPAPIAGLGLENPFAPPVLPVNRQRQEPQVLPVGELQIAADYGGIDTLGANPGVKGYYWVVVTGAVPIAQQEAEYLRCLGLSTVHDEFDDRPTYFDFRVERAEITSDDENAPLEWKPLRRYAREMIEGREGKEPLWPSAAAEVVEPGLALAELADPLGPLVGKSWGSSVAHPKVPLLTALTDEELPTEETGEPVPEEPADDSPFGAGETADEGLPVAEEPAAPTEEEAEPEADRPRGPAGGTRPPRGGGPSGAAANRNRGGGGIGAALTPRIVKERAGGGMSGAARRRGGGGMAGAAAGRGGARGGAMTGGASRPQKAAEYLLFRFFDLAVQEGKRYRYRVTLAVHNPNHGIEVKHLAEGVDGKKKFLTSPVSEPSAVVTVARANNVLAGKVKPGRGSNEANVKVLVRQFDRKHGEDVAIEMDAFRGQLLNYDNQSIPPAANDRNAEPREADLRTDSVLVDITGGEPLRMPGGNDTVPAVLAFLDPDGRLVVRDELADFEDYEKGLGIDEAAVEGGRPTSADEGEDPADGRRPGNRRPTRRRGVGGEDGTAEGGGAGGGGGGFSGAAKKRGLGLSAGPPAGRADDQQ